MGWMLAGIAAWVLLAVPAAVLLGRSIDRAERREVGTPEPDTTAAPARRRSSRRS